MAIRFATAEDTPVILQLIQAIAEYEHLSHEVTASLETLHDSLFVRHAAEVLLAEEQGQILGYALFFHNYSTFMGRQGMFLEDLFVLPAYRGKGYGKALFLKVAELALERNCARMEWQCLDWNHPSIAFYQRMGAVAMTDWTTYRMTKQELQQLR